jgi:excisionase family DNA binding protein
MANAETLFTPEGAAEHLNLSRSRIFQMMGSGELRSIKIGKARRIPQRAIEELVQAKWDTQNVH